MHGKKLITIIASLFLVCFLLIILPDFNQTKQVNVETPPSNINEQIETNLGDPPAEEEQLQVGTDTDKSVTEEIKEKVREVVEVALDLFKRDQKIVAIGDSLTQGVGDESESGGYVGILDHTFEDQNLNISIENYGKKGNRSDQLLKRLENEKIAASIKEADIVLITIGANDIMNIVKNNFTNLTIEQFEEERGEYVKRLTAIFSKIEELNPDTQIYLIGFYNPFERYFSDIEQLKVITDNWNEAGSVVTGEFENVYFIPTEDLFLNANIELFAEDHFHPNTSGYKLIAQRVLEYLKEFNEETEITTENVE
jgi:lysophospholipase L1-like esterase